MKHRTPTQFRHFGIISTLLGVLIATILAVTTLSAVSSGVTAVPAKGARTIEVRLRGATGTEVALIRIGNLQLFSGQITTEWMTLEIPISSLATGEVEVSFTNDAATDEGDRSLEVDYLSFNGTTIQTESPFVYSEGAFSGVNGCSPGFVQSEILACDGSFVFGVVNGVGTLDRPTDPHGNQRGLPLNSDGDIDVVARGHFGGERFQVLVGGTVIGEAPTTRFWRTYRFPIDPSLSGNVSVAFISDFVADDVDTNLDIDFVEFSGQEHQAEDAWSTGSYVEGEGCGAGYSESQTLHCNGSFVFE